MRVRVSIRARALLIAATLTLWACESVAPLPHRNLARVWNEYSRLPSDRALAIAGDPRRDRWVTGSSGGHPDAGGATEAALSACRKQRAKRRMKAACLLYAVGDEIVWGQR